MARSPSKRGIGEGRGEGPQDPHIPGECLVNLPYVAGLAQEALISESSLPTSCVGDVCSKLSGQVLSTDHGSESHDSCQHRLSQFLSLTQTIRLPHLFGAQFWSPQGESTCVIAVGSLSVEGLTSS